MNKIFILFSLCIFLFFSCSSGKIVPVENFQYTDNDFVSNQLKEINFGIETSPIKSLWRIDLLKNQLNFETLENNVIEDFQKSYKLCEEAVINKFEECIKNKDYVKALQILYSLENIEYDISILSESKNTLEKNIQSFISINEANDAKDMKSFINGTVTVWVDLGIRVNKGLGYADHVIGSGFFIDKDGYIITNYHVISSEVDPTYEGFSRVYVKLAEDTETRIPAKVVGWDSLLDLALLKVEVNAPYSFTLGASEQWNIGDRIYAIGSPVGLDSTLTSGIVSAIDRDLFSVGSVIQIDAAVNAGNSGGPIIDNNGNVQAIVFAGVQGFQGLNFAIPVEYLKNNLPFLYSGGERKHGWIGAFGKTIKADEFENPAGVQIYYVMPGSAAAKSGVKVGDIITSVNGKKISSLKDFQNVLIQILPDSIISLTLWQKNISTNEMQENMQERKVAVYFDERPKNPGFEFYKNDLEQNAFLPLFGMKLVSVSDKGKKHFIIEEVLKGSIADESGFSVHDPVKIMAVDFSANDDIIYVQLFTKKRKNGYFEVSIALGAGLDRSNFF